MIDSKEKINTDEKEVVDCDDFDDEKNQGKREVCIIGFSSTKGGSGKSTCACSIASALSIRGYRVLIIDMDEPQYTTYKFFRNRESFMKNDSMLLRNCFFDISKIGKYKDYNLYREELINLIEGEKFYNYDFIIFDSGGYYNYLTQLVIEFSNILITPINLSAVDFNVLFQYDSNTDRISEGQYTKFVKESKTQNKKLKWYVVPNRIHQISTEYQIKCGKILRGVGDLLGYKVTSSIGDRSIYSQGFDKGITCFDSIHILKNQENLTQSELLILNARKEINGITDQILKDLDL